MPYNQKLHVRRAPPGVPARPGGRCHAPPDFVPGDRRHHAAGLPLGRPDMPPDQPTGWPPVRRPGDRRAGQAGPRFRAAHWRHACRRLRSQAAVAFPPGLPLSQSRCCRDPRLDNSQRQSAVSYGRLRTRRFLRARAWGRRTQHPEPCMISARRDPHFIDTVPTDEQWKRASSAKSRCKVAHTTRTSPTRHATPAGTASRQAASAASAAECSRPSRRPT